MSRSIDLLKHRYLKNIKENPELFVGIPFLPLAIKIPATTTLAIAPAPNQKLLSFIRDLFFCFSEGNPLLFAKFLGCAKTDCAIIF